MIRRQRRVRRLCRIGWLRRITRPRNIIRRVGIRIDGKWIQRSGTAARFLARSWVELGRPWWTARRLSARHLGIHNLQQKRHRNQIRLVI